VIIIKFIRAMNKEFILKDEAKRFCSGIKSYEIKYDGPEEFKNDLDCKIINFSESEDRLIFLYEVHNILEAYLEKHQEKCPHSEAPEKCNTNVFYSKAIFFTEQEIKDLNPEFNFKIFRPFVQVDLVQEALMGLFKFPESTKLYQSALDKLNENRFERNLLDDLRLSLEILLKSILNNNKSIENQNSDLGNFLKDIQSSNECNNMFIKLIEYYSKYQNSYVKHNDKVNSKEIDLIISLTSTFMVYIMNK
jgi:hypothetical protein